MHDCADAALAFVLPCRGMTHTDRALAEAQLLSQLQVRRIEPEERPRWEQLLGEQHYLHDAQLVGEALRYVATTPEGQWLAVLGWASAARHLRPRDRWIGWSEAQQAALLPRSPKTVASCC